MPRKRARASRPTCSRRTDMANRVQKFIDCRSKDKSRREVYIVEGDSAAGAIRTSRDAEFQGVMPVRGKILNCLKEDYPRIFKSDIIMDLMRVLGCGVEVKDKRIKNLGAFDLDNLNWNNGHHLLRTPTSTVITSARSCSPCSTAWCPRLSTRVTCISPKSPLLDQLQRRPACLHRAREKRHP